MFSPSGRLGCIGRLGNRPFLGGFNNPRQADRKGRAPTGFALDRDVTAHHLATPFADCEPEARAAILWAVRSVDRLAWHLSITGLSEVQLRPSSPASVANHIGAIKSPLTETGKDFLQQNRHKAAVAKASSLLQLSGEQRKCMDERLRPPSTRIGALLFPDAILKAEFEANAPLRGRRLSRTKLPYFAFFAPREPVLIAAPNLTFHSTALASKGPRLTFRTVLVETPSRAAIFRMVSRARKASRIRRSISGAIGGQAVCPRYGPL